uniref:Uncharacterized protein n=1 Tax=Scleropages formosus TaxID=113540 RepID=A0A8C9WS70_SCLFO
RCPNAPAALMATRGVLAQRWRRGGAREEDEGGHLRAHAARPRCTHAPLRRLQEEGAVRGRARARPGQREALQCRRGGARARVLHAPGERRFRRACPPLSRGPGGRVRLRPGSPWPRPRAHLGQPPRGGGRALHSRRVALLRGRARGPRAGPSRRRGRHALRVHVARARAPGSGHGGALRGVLQDGARRVVGQQRGVELHGKTRLNTVNEPR